MRVPYSRASIPPLGSCMVDLRLAPRLRGPSPHHADPRERTTFARGVNTVVKGLGRGRYHES